MGEHRTRLYPPNDTARATPGEQASRQDRLEQLEQEREAMMATTSMIFQILRVKSFHVSEKALGGILLVQNEWVVTWHRLV